MSEQEHGRVDRLIRGMFLTLAAIAVVIGVPALFWVFAGYYTMEFGLSSQWVGLAVVVAIGVGSLPVFYVVGTYLDGDLDAD